MKKIFNMNASTFEWVSIKDRTPNDHTTCLVMTSKGIGQARYTEEECFHNCDTWRNGIIVFKDGYFKPIEIEDITHWIDLDDIPRPK